MNFDEYISFLNSKLSVIPGIGTKKVSLFAKLGIHSIWDLLYTFPYRYENRDVFGKIADVSAGWVGCVNAVVSSSVLEKKIKKNMSLYILKVEDSTGVMTVKWFSSPFNKHKIQRGMRYTFFGSIESDKRAKEMLLKDMEPYGESDITGRIIPVYPLTIGLTQKDFRKSISFVLNKISPLYETLPAEIVQRENLVSVSEAISQMHSPDDELKLRNAKHRLAFEEVFILTLALKKMRTVTEIKTNISISDVKCARNFENFIPFTLTEDQKRTINDICLDLKSNKPMNRLVQGDVGSGKTAVAACAAYVIYKNGYQTALMAPTEILAQQHYKAFCKFFESCNMKIALLTGSTKNKGEILNGISDGLYDVVIGTHALIEDRTKFRKLGLCITDEQHRFGVAQRASLSKGEDYPNVLVMSATPIPRTLSLVLYGDLDISIIETLPLGRQKIDTFCVNNTLRERLNGFIEKQISEGSQCFVVCPLIEESENIDALSGADAHKNLSHRFGSDNVVFMHGKVTPSEKDEIMERFKNHEFSVLVSTTVIEVGIDIPNATLMVIENAERFGLSQLHQLRGRVGRGNKKSYCVLVSDCKTDSAKERMNIMCKYSDGFKIAEEDLRLRGCGEFFGTRQHGVPELKIANLFTDMPVVKQATDASDVLLKDNPELSGEVYKNLKLRIDRILTDFAESKILN